MIGTVQVPSLLSHALLITHRLMDTRSLETSTGGYCHLVPDAVNEMLVRLLGEDHAEGIGQVFHLPLCCVLLQDSEHLLLHLRLVTKDIIHLQHGSRKGEGRDIEQSR